MRIRKWYMDCTAGDGTVFIGYAGTLGLGPLSLPVQSTSLHRPRVTPGERWRLGREVPGVASGGGVSWSVPALGLEARWTARSRPLFRTLCAAPGLRVEWRCHLPCGLATVRVEGEVLEGWGYVEELRVEGDVRLLPLEHLHWGRFLSDSRWAVWLHWAGGHPLTLVFLDGEEVPGSVGDDEVALGAAGRIPLPGPGEDITVLADRRVGDAFLPSLPLARRALPPILADLRERKLSGPGWLAGIGGDGLSAGRLLYETVSFP